MSYLEAVECPTQTSFTLAKIREHLCFQDPIMPLFNIVSHVLSRYLELLLKRSLQESVFSTLNIAFFTEQFEYRPDTVKMTRQIPLIIIRLSDKNHYILLDCLRIRVSFSCQLNAISLALQSQRPDFQQVGIVGVQSISFVGQIIFNQFPHFLSFQKDRIMLFQSPKLQLQLEALINQPQTTQSSAIAVWIARGYIPLFVQVSTMNWIAMIPHSSPLALLLAGSLLQRC
eukprot:403346121